MKKSIRGRAAPSSTVNRPSVPRTDPWSWTKGEPPPGSPVPPGRAVVVASVAPVAVVVALPVAASAVAPAAVEDVVDGDAVLTTPTVIHH